jgi:hypothetical protein
VNYLQLGARDRGGNSVELATRAFGLFKGRILVCARSKRADKKFGRNKEGKVVGVRSPWVYYIRKNHFAIYLFFRAKKIIMADQLVPYTTTARPERFLNQIRANPRSKILKLGR